MKSYDFRGGFSFKLICHDYGAWVGGATTLSQLRDVKSDRLLDLTNPYGLGRKNAEFLHVLKPSNHTMGV